MLYLNTLRNRGILKKMFGEEENGKDDPEFLPSIKTDQDQQADSIKPRMERVLYSSQIKLFPYIDNQQQSFTERNNINSKIDQPESSKKK